MVARTHRCAILLYSYNYALKYRCGKENPNADFRCRFPSPESNEQTSIQNPIFMSELIHYLITSADVASFSKKDPIFASVTDCVSNGRFLLNLGKVLT